MHSVAAVTVGANRVLKLGKYQQACEALRPGNASLMRKAFYICYFDILTIQSDGLSSILQSTAIGFHSYMCNCSVCMIDGAQGVAIDGFAVQFDG